MDNRIIEVEKNKKNNIMYLDLDHKLCAYRQSKTRLEQAEKKERNLSVGARSGPSKAAMRAL